MDGVIQAAGAAQPSSSTLQQQPQQHSFNKSAGPQESLTLPMPSNYQSHICPLNVLLYHIGHFHNHQSHYNSHNNNNNHNHQYPPIYSYHNNYMHHNHYQHLNNLSRGAISLMLLSELVCTDGADFDWNPYLPIIFHFCLINFDNSRQIIGEHAKKLFLGVIYVLTIQNELYHLTDFLLESTSSIIDNQSIIYDRKYTTTTTNLIVDTGARTQPNNMKLSSANCHYNFNFNARIASANLKGYGNLLFQSELDHMDYPAVHRNLINMHSAPSSPGQHLLQQQQQSSNPPNQSNNNNNNLIPNATSSTSANNSEKSASLKLNKKVNKIQKAKEYLTNVLNILARSKNSPVWPYEFITAQNYARQLTSVQILNEFVVNLKHFLNICLSTKQVSTISSASVRSFSSPINLTTRINAHEMNRYNIDKKWSHYALMTSLNNSISHHYASRSLQIYRALGIKINSFNTMSCLIRRLVETVADLNEDLQSYVTEILLTLKMNANLISDAYVESLKADCVAANDMTNRVSENRLG